MPGMSATAWYSPESLTGVVTDTPVALLVTVTVAFGTAAPDGSVILPAMAPRSTWADTDSTNKTSQLKKKQAPLSNLRAPQTRFIAASHVSDSKTSPYTFDG